MSKQAGSTINNPKNGEKRKYLSQADVPSCSMEKALAIAQAIADNYGYKPATPLQVASALQMAPGAGPFRMLAGASIAYGFTSGGYNAEKIAIEPLGMRVVKITEEGDDLRAKRQALLKPRVIRDFLEKYNGAPIPKEQIGKNVLLDMDVPSERTADVLKLIVDSAESVGFLRDINGKKYVDLLGTQPPIPASGTDESDKGDGLGEPESPADVVALITRPAPSAPAADAARAKRVFITHGKNRALIEPITKLLKFGELEAVVSVQSQTVSQPVPTKVMAEMRACGAAIIHVEDERHLVDKRQRARGAERQCADRNRRGDGSFRRAVHSGCEGWSETAVQSARIAGAALQRPDTGHGRDREVAGSNQRHEAAETSKLIVRRVTLISRARASRSRGERAASGPTSFIQKAEPSLHSG
ncbi:MAG: hypothetical protein L0387_32945 [Acidobacteria bacterium]|nr:hypothetical protein [Acidobacteriota bacterium]